MTLFSIATAFAYGVEQDGIYYNVTNIGATVTYKSQNYNSYSGEVTIPSTLNLINDYNVYSIGESAFRKCSGLTSITIPSSIETIGNLAFSGCTGLTKINITNLAKWCNISFASLSSNPLSSAQSKSLYLNDVEITDLVIPSTVTAINDYAFSLGHFTSITIPNMVKSIGNYAFYYCSGLTSVYIPNYVTSIGRYAFYGCTGLTSVDIGKSVTSIGEKSFNNCPDLVVMTVSSNNNVFDSREDCNAIIETASNTLLYGCKNTIIPNSVTSIGNYAFYECTGLTSVNIPDSVNTIGNYAFNNCSSLTSIYIPNSVTTIGSSAFEGCTGMTSIYIPNSVTTIGSSAFEGCTGMTDVYSYIQDPSNITVGNYAFYVSSGSFDYSGRTLHVPAGTLAAYQADSKWYPYFGQIVEMIPVASIELDHTSAELTEGETLQLTATIMPEDATDKSVIWASSDEAVATVDQNGLVTAMDAGTITITATTTDGSDLSASCTVTVLTVGLNGDVNGDAQVTISDVTSLIDLLLSGDMINNEAADVNGDGVVSIKDVTALIDMLLNGN